MTKLEKIQLVIACSGKQAEIGELCDKLDDSALNATVDSYPHSFGYMACEVWQWAVGSGPKPEWTKASDRF